MDADFRDAKKQERAADDLLMRLEEEANSNASAARINQLRKSGPENADCWLIPEQDHDLHDLADLAALSPYLPTQLAP